MGLALKVRTGGVWRASFWRGEGGGEWNAASRRDSRLAYRFLDHSFVLHLYVKCNAYMFIYIYIYVCIYTCVYCMCVCVSVCLHRHLHLYTYMYAYTHARIHACTLNYIDVVHTVSQTNKQTNKQQANRQTLVRSPIHYSCLHALIHSSFASCRFISLIRFKFISF